MPILKRIAIATTIAIAAIGILGVTQLRKATDDLQNFYEQARQAERPSAVGQWINGREWAEISCGRLGAKEKSEFLDLLQANKQTLASLTRLIALEEYMPEFLHTIDLEFLRGAEEKQTIAVDAIEEGFLSLQQHLDYCANAPALPSKPQSRPYKRAAFFYALFPLDPASHLAIY